MQITKWFPAPNRPFQLFWEKDWLSPARVSSKISTAPKRSGSFWISFQISLYSVITRERSCRSGMVRAMLPIRARELRR